MSNVVNLFKEQQFSTGTAICNCCKHEWLATTGGNGMEMECPNCLTMKGHFKWRYEPPVGSLVFTCNCGCQDFFIMAETNTSVSAVYCRNCGEEKEEWWSK